MIRWNNSKIEFDHKKQPTDYSLVSHYHKHISFEVRPKIQPKILHQF